MEIARVSDNRSVEFELPEPIIQHIQSLLSRPEAARTTLLSKSWFTAWCTRPYLSLYQRDFHHTGGFSNFSRTALQRYRRFNRKLDRFGFSIDAVNDEVSISFVVEIIIDVLKLGVTDLTLGLPSSIFILPVEVFSASSLTKAWIACCKIDDQLPKGAVHWPRVTSLTLICVSVSDDAICAILAGCPLIEIFDFKFCKGFTKVNLSGMHKLRIVIVNHAPDSAPLVELDSVTQFFQLCALELYNVDTCNSFFHEFAVKFPCIQLLKLYHVGGHQNLQISSYSLLYLSVDNRSYDSLQLDVPNICDFRYSGRTIPSLSFSTDSEECESEISVDCRENLAVSSLWFVQLREFLKELKLSKISLVAEYFWGECVLPVVDIPGSSKLELEYLRLGDSLLSTTRYAFLSGLLWFCCPKFVGLNSIHLSAHESLYMRLLENVGQNGPTSTQSLLYVHGLEDVFVEFYEAGIMEWLPIFWEDVVYAWNSIEDVRSRCDRIRFYLKWRDTN